MKKSNEQQLIAQVIPIIRLPKHLIYFDYLVPKKFEHQIKINQIVEIPFHNRKINGIVIEIKNKTQNKFNLKTINKIIEPEIILPKHLIKLIQWMKDYYYTSLPLISKIIFPEIPKRKLLDNKKQSILIHKNIKNLTVSKKSLPKIKETIDSINNQQTKYVLLHYQNWQEKLIVYIKIIKQLLNKNLKGQILIIVPQITDIQKIYNYLNYYFPDQIAILNNKLSKTFFWQEWQKIYFQKAKIILGTRSAIFSPIQNLSMIIVDDEESLSEYKSEQNPRYNVQKLAEKLSEFAKAKLIFSSQAPSIEIFYNAQNKSTSTIFCLYKKKSNIKIINLQDEWQKKNYSLISDNLEEAIKQNLEKKQKIFLFLNRRGAGTIIKCQDCKYLFKCPNCQLPLIFNYLPTQISYELRVTSYPPRLAHFDLLSSAKQAAFSEAGKLICFHCNFTQNIPTKCPHCQGVNIKTFGIGIQRVEKEIKKLFPEAKILRIDKDTQISTSYKLQVTSYDIIIGTQFFFKQFNQPSIFNLIGVISADSLLYRPDFRSSEKTFQQLSKIINWANIQQSEVELPIVIIQTHSPENYVIQALAQQNYNFFYNSEIEMRKKFNYPPFCKLIKLIYQNSDFKKVEKETNELVDKLKMYFSSSKTFEVIGPISPMIPKIKEKYRKQIILKIYPTFHFPASIKKLLNELDENWIIDTDPLEII